jgi:chitinase
LAPRWLAGDYAWNAGKNGGKGEYYMGNTLTTAIYNTFSTAGPYGNVRAESAMPASSARIAITLGSWKLGDDNYPINPVLTVTNNTATAIPGGSVVEFDYPVSAPADMSDQSGVGLKVTRAGYSGPNNIGGFKATFNHAQFTLPAWQTLAPGASLAVTLNYRLPISGPAAYTVTVNGVRYALAGDYPELPVGLP